MHRLVPHYLWSALAAFLAVSLLAGCTTDASGPPSNPTVSANASHTSSASRSGAASAAISRVPATDDRTLRKHLQNASLSARITQALVERRRLRVFDFELESDDGRVTIRGDVNTMKQYRLAERVVRSMNGVDAVANELTVNGKPPSEASSDDSSGESASAVYHTVQPGESLWAIAREYQASVQQIRAMNDLRSESLQVGQRIRVR